MSCLNINKVALAGRITKDIEVKQGRNGAVVAFDVAVNKYTKKAEEPIVNYIPVVAYGDRAEFIGKYFGKGSAIWIDGEIKVSKYEDKNGVNRTSFNVVATNIEFIDSKKDLLQYSEPSNYRTPAETSFNTDDFEEILSDGDVPF